jgi:hypothetical protein
VPQIIQPDSVGCQPTSIPSVHNAFRRLCIGYALVFSEHVRDVDAETQGTAFEDFLLVPTVFPQISTNDALSNL